MELPVKQPGLPPYGGSSPPLPTVFLLLIRSRKTIPKRAEIRKVR